MGLVKAEITEVTAATAKVNTLLTWYNVFWQNAQSYSKETAIES